jgi:hypothetical protein
MSGEEGTGEYLPLSVAAAIAYGSLVPAHKAAHDREVLDEHLDLVAAALSSIVPIFSAFNAHAPQMLAPEQVARGKFRQGAQILLLSDGAETVSGLRVRNADLFLAIEQLRLRPPFGAN